MMNSQINVPTRKGFVPKVSIEERRRVFASRLAESVKADKSMIKMHERTIENFENRGGADVEYNTQRIQKCQSQIEFLLDRITATERKIAGVFVGESDHEIDAISRETRETAQKKAEEAKRKKAMDLERESVSHTEGNAYYKSERSENSKERAMDREYLKLLNCVETVPPHIARNIENTPCNRAYRWRGVLFYGKLPEQAPDMIFEKKDGVTYVTETTPTSEVIFYKDQNKAKHFISRSRRQLQAGLRGPAILTKC